MNELDDYILHGSRLLRTGSNEDIDTLCRDAKKIFNLGCINPEEYKYINSPGNYSYSKSDLRTVLSMLRVARESQDKEQYGIVGCQTITQHIRQLENALEEGFQGDELQSVYERIDSIYANYYKSYTDGLCGYCYTDYDPCDSQTILRIDKLKHFRDKELRDFEIAKSQNTQISLSQNQKATAMATSTAVVNLIETCDEIDAIPDDKLSEEDKDHLKGLLTSLEQAVNKNKSDKQSRLSKILSFLADKSADAFIASAPFIWNLIQPM